MNENQSSFQLPTPLQQQSLQARARLGLRGLSLVGSISSRRVRNCPNRRIAFPAERSLGVLRATRMPPPDWSADPGDGSGFVSWDEYFRLRPQDWQPLGSAAGEVAVPLGTAVGLWLSPNAVFDLSPLQHLRSDDLQLLSFAGTQPQAGAIKYIARLTRLEQLDLEGTGLDDSVVRHLDNLLNLRELDLWGTAITETGLMDLIESHPGCSIRPPSIALAKT
jgi:hypothetical protein